MNKVTVNGREYEVEAMTTPERVRFYLQSIGFDGLCYQLTGKRGSVRMAYKSTHSGNFTFAA